jgi:ketosteroid isomerase-like protein
VSDANNVELVRHMFEAYKTTTPERAFEFLHPEVRYDVTVRPDGKVWHGHDGVRGALLEWTSTWEDWEMDVERYIDAGDDRVLVLWNERGRAKGSGVPLSLAGATVCTLRDGMVWAMVVSVDRPSALRAVGLHDP